MMDNLILTPVAGYCLIIPPKEKEDSSIIIKKEKQDAYVQGQVLKVGKSYYQDGIKFDPPCKDGDLVLYGYSGYEDVIHKGGVVRLVKFSQIVGVYSESN